MASILIWSDEADSCLLAQRVVEKLNHKAVIFTKFDKALDWVIRDKADLSIIDSKEDVSVMKLLEIIRILNPRGNVFITTTDSPSSDYIKKIKRLGAEVFFSRPIEIEALEKKIISVLAAC